MPEPWWSPLAAEMLEEWVCFGGRKVERAFEWGSGGSTHWLLDISDKVVTVEHDAKWADKIESMNDPRVTLLFRSLGSGYEGAIDTFEDASFDLISIDGRRRVACFRHALPKLKPGGILVFDDVQRGRYAQAMVRIERERWLRASFMGGPQSEGDRVTLVAVKP